MRFLTEAESKYPSFRDAWDFLTVAVHMAAVGVESAANKRVVASPDNAKVVSDNADAVRGLGRALRDDSRCVCGVDVGPSTLLNAAVLSRQERGTSTFGVLSRFFDAVDKIPMETFAASEIDLNERESAIFAKIMGLPVKGAAATESPFSALYAEAMEGGINAELLGDRQQFELIPCHVAALRDLSRGLESRRHLFAEVVAATKGVAASVTERLLPEWPDNVLLHEIRRAADAILQGCYSVLS